MDVKLHQKEGEKKNTIRITSHWIIIFSHHNGHLDQPEVVEASDVVEQQLRPIRLVAEQYHLLGQVHPDLGKNSRQGKSYEGTCYRVVVADGVVAAERYDKNLENTAEWRTETLVDVVAEEK